MYTLLMYICISFHL